MGFMYFSFANSYTFDLLHKTNSTIRKKLPLFEAKVEALNKSDPNGGLVNRLRQVQSGIITSPSTPSIFDI